MTTPGELVTALAEATKYPLATLAGLDRYLAEAGLRTKGGRGRSAPKTTPRDLAHLTVAMLSSEQVQHSVHSVRRYEATVPAAGQSSSRLFVGSGIAELEALPRAHSFVDALEAVASSLIDGSLAQLIRPKGSRQTLRLPLSIEIGASSPGTLGIIRIAGLKRHGVRAVRYLLPDPFDRKRSPSTAELQAWEARIKQFRIESYFDAYRTIKEEALFRLVTQLMSSGGK